MLKSAVKNATEEKPETPQSSYAVDIRKGSPTFGKHVAVELSEENERGIAYDDPALGIEWLIDPSELQLSEKDKKQPAFEAADLFDYSVDFYA